VRCFAVAASAGAEASLWGHLLGDGLVPVDSALGRHRDPARCLGFPPDHTWTAQGLDHMDLLDHPAVYDRILGWLQG
jgi:hypothetical protein